MGRTNVLKCVIDVKFHLREKQSFSFWFVFQGMLGVWLVSCLVLYTFGTSRLLGGKVALCVTNSNSAEDVTGLVFRNALYVFWQGI